MRSHDEIEEIVLTLLKEHGYDSKIPVPVEALVEDLGLIITEVPGLRKHGLYGTISADLDEIYIDKDIADKDSHELCFTIAHELAHYILHKDYFSKNKFEDVRAWKNIVQRDQSKIFKALDAEAHAFASLLMMPETELRREYDQLFNAKSKDHPELKKIDLEMVITFIAKPLATKFKIAEGFMQARLKTLLSKKKD